MSTFFRKFWAYTWFTWRLVRDTITRTKACRAFVVDGVANRRPLPTAPQQTQKNQKTEAPYHKRPREAVPKSYAAELALFGTADESAAVDRLPDKPTRRRRTKAEIEAEHRAEADSGRYARLVDLLDDLEVVFAALDDLKPGRSDNERVAARMGVHLIDSTWDRVRTRKLESTEVFGLPSFIGYTWHNDRIWREDCDNPGFKGVAVDKDGGGAHMTAELADGERLVQTLFVANKLESVQSLLHRPEQHIYECSYLYHMDRRLYEQQFFIAIDPRTFTYDAIPVPRSVASRIKHKRHHKQRGREDTIHHWVWQYPNLSTHTDPELQTRTQLERKLYAEEMFAVGYNLTLMRELGVNIVVRRGKGKNARRLTFTVPENRWERFFRERIDVKTSSGRKRPIFHAVASHTRTLPDGKQTPVKTHYRGSQQFKWEGFEVKILMPGRDSVARAAVDLQCYAANEKVSVPHDKGVDPYTAKHADLINDLIETFWSEELETLLHRPDDQRANQAEKNVSRH